MPATWYTRKFSNFPAGVAQAMAFCAFIPCSIAGFVLNFPRKLLPSTGDNLFQVDAEGVESRTCVQCIQFIVQTKCTLLVTYDC